MGRWADFARRSDPRLKNKNGNTLVAPKGATPVFLHFPVFLVPQLDPLPVFDGLAVFRQRRTKNTDYAWISPATVYLHDLMVTYLTNARLTKVKRREGYVILRVYNIFLTHAYNWMHNCIWDWTWDWDTALNTSAV